MSETSTVEDQAAAIVTAAEAVVSGVTETVTHDEAVVVTAVETAVEDVKADIAAVVAPYEAAVVVEKTAFGTLDRVQAALKDIEGSVSGELAVARGHLEQAENWIKRHISVCTRG